MTIKHPNLFKSVFLVVLFFLMYGRAYSFDLEHRVIKTKLSNGVTILMVERALSPTVSLYIRYRVGAVDENQGESGAAHLLEHMMFKGTTTIGAKNAQAEKKLLEDIKKTGMLLDQAKRNTQNPDSSAIKELSGRLKKLQDKQKEYFIPNEIDRLYTENGGLDMNASTGQDVTTYHVSLPANKIELWARIESDRLLNPVFREFYTERDVVMEERRQRVESDPDGKLYENFIRTAYTTHPYGRPVLGWAEDLMNLSPVSLEKILKKYHNPSGIVIAVVGDIQPEKTLKIIEKYFGRIPAGNPVSEKVSHEPEQTRERRSEIFFDANPMLIMGFHKPSPPDYNDYIFDVLETILSKGRTSRLYNNLVTHRQIAKSVSAVNGIPGIRYPNLFTILAQPRHPHTNIELEEKIMEEIEKIKNVPVTDEELTKAKNNIKMEYVQSLDSNSEIASILSYCEILLGDYRYFSGYLNNVEKVTAEDIQKAASAFLNKDNLTITVLNKKAQ